MSSWQIHVGDDGGPIVVWATARLGRGTGWIVGGHAERDAGIYPVTAQALIGRAQSIIDAITGGTTTPGKVKIAMKPNGKSRLNIPGVPGQIYIIEASSDLLSWEMIGIANDQTNGDFIFDDDKATNAPTRYYRIIVP